MPANRVRWPLVWFAIVCGLLTVALGVLIVLGHAHSRVVGIGIAMVAGGGFASLVIVWDAYVVSRLRSRWLYDGVLVLTSGAGWLLFVAAAYRAGWQDQLFTPDGRSPAIFVVCAVVGGQLLGLLLPVPYQVWVIQHLQRFRCMHALRE